MLMSKIKITTLVDDFNGAESGYIRSYGFAAVIEIKGKNILFDAGTKVQPLMVNLQEFGLDPEEIDAVILSHNHYDHTDGLPGILREHEAVPVYVHKDWDEPASFKGFQVPKRNRVTLKNGRECTEICSGLHVTPSHFSSDYGGVYEHACFLEAKDSFILLCGCCHAGLNTFLRDRQDLGIPENVPLHLMGGMHGFRFSDEEAQGLHPQVKSVLLFHCTMNAQVFRRQFMEKCKTGVVGKTLTFS